MRKVKIFFVFVLNVLFKLIGAPSLSKMTKNGCPPNHVALYYPSAQPNPAYGHSTKELYL